MGEYLDGYGHITMYNINILKNRGPKMVKKRPPPKTPPKRVLYQHLYFRAGAKQVGLWRVKLSVSDPPKKVAAPPCSRRNQPKRFSVSNLQCMRGCQPTQKPLLLQVNP